jgi:tetratricopeptide (TPR) repeat protein
MRRHWLAKAVILLALAGLAVAVRRDIAELAVYQGRALLRAGDVVGAETAFGRALALGGTDTSLAYDLGVGLYRQGEFGKAQQRFTAALAAAEGELAVASYYNRGNCWFRQAERLATSDREAARRFFEDAVADYGRALTMAPEAMDAGDNLNLARARLAALGHSLAPGPSQRAVGAEESQRQEAANGSHAKAESKQALPGTHRGASDSARQAVDQADAIGKPGETRRDLTPDEVERLLNDARGRERVAGPLHGGTRSARLAEPEKNW